MNEQFTQQAQELFNVAKDTRIPENLQNMAEESVAKGRETYQRLNSAVQEQVKTAEEVMLATHASTKTISQKLMHNATSNTEAMFEAAHAIAQAKTVPEVARLQMDFFQQQAAAATTQAKELFELSTKVAKQTFETINTATVKSFEQMKKTD